MKGLRFSFTKGLLFFLLVFLSFLLMITIFYYTYSSRMGNLTPIKVGVKSFVKKMMVSVAYGQFHHWIILKILKWNFVKCTLEDVENNNYFKLAITKKWTFFLQTIIQHRGDGDRSMTLDGVPRPHKKMCVFVRDFERTSFITKKQNYCCTKYFVVLRYSFLHHHEQQHIRSF